MRILHLSDLHYGTSEINTAKVSTHAFTSNQSLPNPRVLPQILAEDPELKKCPPDLLVVSGDVGWSGSPDDYELSDLFFEGIRAYWPRVPLLVTPGNHDVNLGAGVSDFARQDAFLEMMRRLYGKDFGVVFPWVDSASDGSVSIRDRLVGVIQTQEWMAFTVNSAACLTRDESFPEKFREKGPVFIRHQVLTYLDNLLAGLPNAAGLLKIFVLHHHLLPFAEPSWSKWIDDRLIEDRPDDTIVANSAKLQAFLASHQFAVVLHGHKHLSHGREDVLWRKHESNGASRMVIVGAGSAGVYEGQRSNGEPLSYNVLDVRPAASSTWEVQVLGRQIETPFGPPRASRWLEYRAVAGRPVVRPFSTFHTDRMDHCHTEIAASADSGTTLFFNFISVVENPTYYHPISVRDGKRHPPMEEVWDSFLALHPEYHKTWKWNDEKHVEETLRRTSNRHRIEHGPRMFGLNGAGSGKLLQPILESLRELNGGPGRGYSGLYWPEVDAHELGEASPGLVGVQFLREDDRLDLVATFRHLELSFWWAVNMLEMIELLRWAVTCKEMSQHDLKPRRITLFAARAEWKTESPGAIFNARLDEIPTTDLISLVLRAGRRDETALRELGQLLGEKIQRTHSKNLDSAGLSRLVPIVEAVSGAHSTYTDEQPIYTQVFLQDLRLACENIEEAIRYKGMKPLPIEISRQALLRATKALEASLKVPS